MCQSSFSKKRLGFAGTPVEFGAVTTTYTFKASGTANGITLDEMLAGAAFDIYATNIAGLCFATDGTSIKLRSSCTGYTFMQHPNLDTSKQVM